jgi:Ulp1 protease family, C-terminal catalytic domain
MGRKPCMTKKRCRRKKHTIKRHQGGYHIPTNHYPSIPPTTSLSLAKCSPYAYQHHIGNTCYTKEALQMLKENYNQTSKKTPIVSSTPEQILSELYQRFPTCQSKQGTCLVDGLSDISVKKKLTKHLFRPKKPKEWKQHPTEWLSNFDLDHVLQQYEESDPSFVLLGISPIDYDTKLKDGTCVHQTLCTFTKQIHTMIRRGKTKFAAIFNLSTHDQPGSHWVTLYINIVDTFIFYFDSTGEKPPIPIQTLIKKITWELHQKEHITMTYYESSIEHQRGNSECGMYALYFLVTMISNIQYPDCAQDATCQLQKKLDLFLTQRIEDSFIQTFRDKYFIE